MKTRVIKTAGALLLGFLMITAVNAQNRQGGRGQGYNGSEKSYGHQFAKLELSEEQQAEITSLRTGHYKEITPLKNKMAELKARERTLLSEENVDMKAVNKTIDEQTDLMNSIRKLQVEQQVAVKSLLTDEQLMQVQQHRQFAKRSGFHGKSGHRSNRAYRGAGMGRGYRGI
jgi:Spy/CpxP family protein refolding chaperone